MSRRTTLASVCAVLIIFVILAVAAGITQGQGATTSVKGFPFVQIGMSYCCVGGTDFRVTKDLGNGWIEVQTNAYLKLFLNLNQMNFIQPRS